MSAHKKHPGGRPKVLPGPPGPTPQIQFRLAPDTLADMDFLAARLGLGNRSAVLRLAVKRLADAERRRAG